MKKYFNKKAKKIVNQNLQKDKDSQYDEDILLPDSKGAVSEQSLKEQFKNIDDFKCKKINVKSDTLTLYYVSSMTQGAAFQELVVDPLIEMEEGESIEDVLFNKEEVKKDELPQLIQDVLGGYTAIFSANTNKVYKVNVFSVPWRGIASSETETTMLGPHDSFIESLMTNVSLIKRRIRNPKLKVKNYTVGTEMRTEVNVLYLEGIANKENVERAVTRIKNVEYTGFIDISVLKQCIEDNAFSIFPQFLLTERPDTVANYILDGRIIILLDNSPQAIVCPISFLELFNSPEDYYNRWNTASMIRILRFFCFFVTIVLTSTYVSVLTFHLEMLPPQLLRLLAESRSQVPFPPVIEVLGIELVIEILREAGARMPTKIGSSIGIVGGIVLGTAAVEAGLASNILIVIVAVSALMSFTPANFLMSNSIRFVRYFFIIGAGIFGMLGQFVVFVFMLLHLLNLTSLGTPFLTPVIPRKWTDLLDSAFLRAPFKFLSVRKGVSQARKLLMRPFKEE